MVRVDRGIGARGEPPVRRDHAGRSCSPSVPRTTRSSVASPPAGSTVCTPASTRWAIGRRGGGALARGGTRLRRGSGVEPPQRSRRSGASRSRAWRTGGDDRAEAAHARRDADHRASLAAGSRTVRRGIPCHLAGAHARRPRPCRSSTPSSPGRFARPSSSACSTSPRCSEPSPAARRAPCADCRRHRARRSRARGPPARHLRPARPFRARAPSSASTAAASTSSGRPSASSSRPTASRRMAPGRLPGRPHAPERAPARRLRRPALHARRRHAPGARGRRRGSRRAR